MRHPLILLVVLAALVASACGDADTGTTVAEDATDTTDTQTSTPATDDTEETDEPTEDLTDEGDEASEVEVASSDLGDILVDDEGNTLYLFLNDEQGESTCYDDCAENWPALAGPAEAGEGADESLLGTVERDDGTQQVTYNDWPLYYFAGDAQAGDVNGQGVGDVWFAVTPDGEQVE